MATSSIDHNFVVKDKKSGKKVRDFIKRLNPYSMPKPLNVDLRMFLEYVDTHEIDKSTITEELVQKFSR